MSDDIQIALYRISELERQIKIQATEIAHIEERNVSRDRERAATERKQLYTGITALGAVILALAGVIWSYRGVIFRGDQ